MYYNKFPNYLVNKNFTKSILKADNKYYYFKETVL
jgi:hypothetical protein